MELIQGFIQPPKVPSVESTIPTLCDRVEYSTLIGDRRSAVLGLKSFSREYRETVIASGLKPLINALRKDYEDEDSAKAILETLLILFIRGEGFNDLTRTWVSQQSRLQNSKYPSPLIMKQELEKFDQFSLWIADALTQSNDLVHLLVQLAETGNFHIRLYAIQLLEAIITTRPFRAREAIMSLPTGVSTLVSMLETAHDPIRDETILLLMAVANDNHHIQKLVAFENIFERLFQIIEAEGGLRGSIVVQDCLFLINIILRYNASNQSLFFETGNLPYIARLLDEPLSSEEFYWNDQRVSNIKAALDIVRLTVEPGDSVTSAHQQSFFKANILMTILRLAFFRGTPNSIRPLALLTTADIIRGNNAIQRQLGNIDVPFWDPSLPQLSPQSEIIPMPVVDLLLNWILYANSVHTFEIRIATLELLKAYLSVNPELCKEFVQLQIDQFKAGFIDNGKQNINILSALLDYDPHLNLNPYKLFFASDLILFLFQSEDSEHIGISDMLREVVSGDDSNGVEELTSIQSIIELLLMTLSSPDCRIPISYLSLLIVWLFEDFLAVNAFLSNKSNIKSLLNYVSQFQDENMTVRCMIVMLLGVAYEFSSDSSPLSRAELYEMLFSTIGVDNYASRIRQFKESSLFSTAGSYYFDHEFDDTGLPKIYFNSYFTELFRENYYRIQSALRRSPDTQPNLKISFKDFDELQQQFSAVTKHLESLQTSSSETIEGLENKLEVLKDELRSLKVAKEEYTKDISLSEEKYSELSNQLDEANKRIRELSDKNAKLDDLKKNHLKSIENNKSRLAEFKDRIISLEKSLHSITEEKKKAEEGINKMSRELFSLSKEKSLLSTEMDKLKSASDKEKSKLSQVVGEREAHIAKMKTELADIFNQKNQLEISNESLSKELSDIKPRFSSHEMLIPKLTEKLKSLATNCKELEIKNNSLKKQLDEARSTSSLEIASLKSEIETLVAEKSILDQKSNNLEVQLGKIQRELELAKVEVEDSKTKLSDENSRLHENLKNLKDQLSSITSERDQQKLKSESLAGDLTKVSAEIKKLQNDYESLIKKLKVTNSDLDSCNERLKQSQIERDTLELEFKTISTQNSELQKKIEDLTLENKSNTASLSEDIFQNDSTVDKSDEFELEELRTALKNVTANYDAAKAKVDELERNLRVLSEKSKNNDYNDNSELKKLQSQIADYKGKLSNTETNYTDLKKAYEELEKTHRLTLKEAEKSSTNSKSQVGQVSDLSSDVENSKGGKDDYIVESNSEKAQLETELENLKNQLQIQRDEMAAKNNLLDTKLAELAVIHEESNDLRSKLEQFQKKAANSESERDDLILLVSELDEKNQKYRAKLQTLGHPVSSDEDTDAENEDE
ncbi:Uso1p Ecym_5345 [Eremothecium cymbalariae DBVPG|uniref:Vesicle tethering protein Uso1/P115-like head domain-containing protein n=1 Tax=Eremothecium cymbalariae (strain CBS 270.75 / DBVPG 7215 / KCTC 17166 / NRRL Y-17582) TaxID=931890 RepID=I6NDG2_ERECY|nr:hypothetical protein Ecym_5345 [Eremothecium cymbalariae DBVPG\